VITFTEYLKYFFSRLHQTLNWPYIAIALPMSVMLFIVVFVLEYFWDYERDIKQIGVSVRGSRRERGLFYCQVYRF
jgi:hypothetical protein